MTNWFLVPRPLAAARLQLVCLPYAGASAAVYRNWAPLLAPRIEVLSVQLPGRGSRWQERSFEQLNTLVVQLAEILESRLNRPFAFFGHSFGALVALELTRQLRRNDQPMPTTLIVSGRCPPHLPSPSGPAYDLPNDRFVRELRHLGGMADEILQDDELLDFFLPAVRADFRMLQTWTYREEPPLDLPIVVFGGRQDVSTPVESLREWSRHSTRSLSVHLFQGGHFFINHATEKLCPRILAELL